MGKKLLFLIMVIAMLLGSAAMALATLDPQTVIDRAAGCMGKERKDIRNLKGDDIFDSSEPGGNMEFIRIFFEDSKKVNKAIYGLLSEDRSYIMNILSLWKLWFEGMPNWRIIRQHDGITLYSDGKLWIVMQDEEQNNNDKWILACAY